MNNYCNNCNNYVYHPDLNELQTFKKKKIWRPDANKGK